MNMPSTSVVEDLLLESSMIHMIPFDIMRKLCVILDNGNTWEEIGHMPEMSKEDVDGCRKYSEHNLNGAAWFLLRIWGSKGYTILSLYKLFAVTKMVRCMQAMRELIDPKYHYLETTCLGAEMASAPRMNTSPSSATSTRVVQGGSLRQHASHGGEPSSSSVLRPPTTSTSTSSSQSVPSDSAGLFSGLQNTPQVAYSELEVATENFAQSNIIGKGGYGVVYKGEWKHTKVAVKRLHSGNDKSNQFEKERLRQSLQELRTLAKYRHDNILPLYGFSLDGPEPCLVYQFMANGSLEDRLFCRRGTPPLTWQQKHDIAEGAARGLHFLHSIARTPIIHGDVKTANILLDKHLEPKLGDFGLSRDGQVEADVEEKCPLIASHIKGTLAYLPPEFITSKILSTKLDVFSFGVVLLELATGLRAYVDSRMPHSLVDYCACIRDEKNDRDAVIFEMLVDKRTPVAEGDLARKCFARMFRLGLCCSHKERNERPSFKHVVDTLSRG